MTATTGARTRWLILGSLGAVVIVTTLITVILLVSEASNTRVNLENWDRFAVGMTRREVEEIFGSGRRSSVAELEQAVRKEPSDPLPYRIVEDHRVWYRWDNGGTSIFVAFEGPGIEATADEGCYLAREPDSLFQDWRR